MEGRVEALESRLEKENENEGDYGNLDEKIDDVVRFVDDLGVVSASAIQRHFNFGYNRSARLVDQLESLGICGPQRGSQPRYVNKSAVKRYFSEKE